MDEPREPAITAGQMRAILEAVPDDTPIAVIYDSMTCYLAHAVVVDNYPTAYWAEPEANLPRVIILSQDHDRDDLEVRGEGVESAIVDGPVAYPLLA